MPLGGGAHSTGVDATLAGQSGLSVAADDLLLLGRNLLPGKSSFLVSGTLQINAGSGTLFGDGLLRVSGQLRLIALRIPNAAGEANWGPGLAAANGWSVGDTRTFQVWYRDGRGIPCGTNFNLSSATSGIFVP